MSKYDKWKTTNPDDVGHDDECCVSLYPHWKDPRCTCQELKETKDDTDID